MANILTADRRAMVLMPRFGIDMGFGDKTVKEICREKKIDPDFFLLMVNVFLHPHHFPDKKLQNTDPDLLLTYLANSHDYYIREKIPSLKALVDELLEKLTFPVKDQLFKFFTDYIEEVLEHIDYEEKTVFPYISDLVSQPNPIVSTRWSTGYNIRLFEEKHDNIEVKLSDLKNLLIKYFPPAEDRYLRIRILNELFDLEQDLIDHARLEDKVLIPIVRQLEQNKTQP